MNKSAIVTTESLEEKISLKALQNSMKFDLTLEAVKSEFFDANVIQEQPETLYRVDYDYTRFYCRVVKDEIGNVIDYYVYPSLTSIIKKNMPTDRYLLKWWADLGYDRSVREMAISASYGTLLHILFSEILRGNSVHLNDGNLNSIIQMYTQYERWHSEININDWIKKLKQDIIGFIIWIQEYEIEPIGIEFIEYSDTMKYATAIDLIAFARLKKDSEKEIVIVDYKSGRKDFYDEYPIQLRAARTIWNEFHPDHMVERVFNYGCKDYRIPIGKSVTPYRFKDQTDEMIANRWNEYLTIFHREFMPEKEDIIKRTVIDSIPVNKDLDIKTAFAVVDVLQSREVEF